MAQAANTNAIQSIAVPAGAVGQDATHVSLWTAARAGSFLWAKAISTNPDALALGERYEIAADALVLNQPTGAGETEAMATRALNGRIAGTLHLQFHTGAPGANGTANVLPALPRVAIAQAAWTLT